MQILQEIRTVVKVRWRINTERYRIKLAKTLQ